MTGVDASDVFVVAGTAAVTAITDVAIEPSALSRTYLGAEYATHYSLLVTPSAECITVGECNIHVQVEANAGTDLADNVQVRVHVAPLHPSCALGCPLERGGARGGP